ncbi:MAG: serine protease [Gemmataceae bacterium]|nr:serine protease [Gemmataceae bacterium]
MTALSPAALSRRVLAGLLVAAGLGAGPAAAADPAVDGRVKRATLLVEGKYGYGTGFVILPGVVATNSHVVIGQLADDLGVRFIKDGVADPNPVKARLLYEDPARDLALLWVNDPRAADPLKVADGFDPAARPNLLFCGTPLQPDGRSRVAVTAAGRATGETALIDGQTYVEAKVAAGEVIEVGPGSSGGAAVNDRGEVVGVVAMVRMAVPQPAARRAPAGQPDGTVFFVPLQAVQDAVKAVGPVGGWDRAASRAAARHAAVTAHVASGLIADVSWDVVEVRVDLKSRGFDFAADQRLRDAAKKVSEKVRNDYDRLRITDLARDGWLTPDEVKDIRSHAENATLLTNTAVNAQFNKDTFGRQGKLASATHDLRTKALAEYGVSDRMAKIAAKVVIERAKVDDLVTTRKRGGE